jgi:hypothetical protein
MKRVVSVSLGSVKRNKKVTVTLLGEEITMERIGTDGDEEKATQLYNELDGKVDAFGVGGIDLGMSIGGRYYPIHAAQKMVAGVKHTPVVDGGGLHSGDAQNLERGIAQFIEQEIGDEVHPKRVLITTGVDRYSSALSFAEAGYEMVFGDLGFGLGIPIPIRSLRGLRTLARILMPIVGRMPISVLYPTGEKQEEIVPKFGKWYNWATVISGDCLYIKQHMPDQLDGKVIATNTTTPADIEAFRQRGVRYLVTITPQIEGRSFGTNLLEASLVAIAGKGRPLTDDELGDMVAQLDLKPTLLRLGE